jgi:hypothetical protein
VHLNFSSQVQLKRSRISFSQASRLDFSRAAAPLSIFVLTQLKEFQLGATEFFKTVRTRVSLSF